MSAEQGDSKNGKYDPYDGPFTGLHTIKMIVIGCALVAYALYLVWMWIF
jgi:hypothetical protein